MQKLTRTQKYADLRDQLANDKEANISSDDLTGYQNRLDAVQETLTPNQGRAEETFKQESEYVFDSYNQNQVGSNQSYEEPKDDSYFDSFMNTSQDVKAGGDFNSYFESESKEDEYNIDNIFSEVFADVKDSTAEAIVKNERENYLVQRPAVEEKTEDVIEIKNIAEMESEPVKDTVSSTIPFVVASSDEDEIEDDEEESPNTVLNIILIVLIVALIAVLGLIVFYILKTKGIF